MILRIPFALSLVTVAFICFQFHASDAHPSRSLPRQQPTPIPSPASKTPSVTTVDPLAVELSYWQTIKDSKRVEDFKAYLTKYPNGEFAALAKIRLNSLGSKSSAFDELLEAHIRALGDKAAIEKIRTLVLKGTVEVTVNGQNARGTTERYFKFPDNSFVLISLPFGNLIEGFDGITGWKNMGKGVVTMNAWETAFENRSNLLFTHITQADQFTSAYKSFTVRGKLQIDNREVQVADAEPLNGQRETLYFDARTGLLYRWDIIFEGEGADKTPNQLYADEYTTIDGMRVLSRIHVVTPTATISSSFTDIRTNVDIDDSRFRKQ